MLDQTHITDFVLGDASQDGVQLQMFSSSQQLVDGVKLRTVTNVLMDLIDLPQDTGDMSQTGHRHVFRKCDPSLGVKG